MVTSSQEEAAIISALEAAATTDASLISAFISANGSSVTTLVNNLNSLSSSLADQLHQQQAQGFASQLSELSAAFTAWQASVVAAETSPPPA